MGQLTGAKVEIARSTTSEKPKIWETRNTVLNSSVFSIFSAKIISST